MKVTRKNNTYRCTDIAGTWYPQGQTHLEAIQHALSVIQYWKTINR